jgi:hypothetical protein
MKFKNKYTYLLSSVIIITFMTACQSTNTADKLDTGGKSGHGAMAATAPTFTVGDTYHFAVTKSKRGTREFVRTYDGVRDGHLVFLDDQGQENTFSSKDLNAIRIGQNQYTPDAGQLRFPMQVGDSWTHPYTDKNPTETRQRERSCAVKSWEPVQVMAGEFMAFRIDCSNQWSEARYPADERYWYAPAAKFIIKYESAEWYYSSELKSYDLMKTTAAN